MEEAARQAAETALRRELQQRHSEEDAQAADERLVDATAQIALLERQAETMRAQARAAQAALRTELSALTVGSNPQRFDGIERKGLS